MVAERKKITPTFFPTTSVGLGNGAEKDLTPQFVDVGGTGDCGFRSLAAGFIDNFLTQPSKIRASLLKQVLDHHFRYFPEYKTSIPGTPEDKMARLIKAGRMGELVHMLAYTFRQIAVDELCRHPEYYRGAFVQDHEQTSPAEMRLASTWIDESSIAAFSNALQMPVDVLLGDNPDTLRKRLRYNRDADNQSVTMRLRGAHYIPRLVNHERFSLVKSQIFCRLQPEVDKLGIDPSLPEILIKINAEDRRLLASFEQTKNRLTWMVSNGELSKLDLLAIYIKGMGTSDYLSNRAKHASIEHGSQHFFNLICNAQKDSPALDEIQKTDELALIHALSRAISIGHLSEDMLDQAGRYNP